MIRHKGILAISLILTLTLTLILAGCAKKTVQVSAEDNIKNVKVAPVSNSSIETDTKYGGQLSAFNQTGVTSKIAGQIDNVKVNVGQPVKKGDILFTVDASPFQIQYAEAKAALDTANATLVKTSDASYEQQLIPAKTSVDTSQNLYNDAKNNYNTIHQQYNIGDSSKDELDAAQSKMNSAVTQLSAANDSLALLKSKVGPQSNAAVAGQVEQAKASLDLAQLQLNNCVITSPVDGIVSARNVESGEMVSSSITAFTIIDTSSLFAEVTMTDKNVIKVKVGQKLSVQITSINNKVVEGIVDAISPTADAKTQLYMVKLKIDNKNNSLKTGMIVRAIFPDEIRKNILAIPNGAIFTENSVQYVYIVVANKLKKITVGVGISNTTETEIISGLKLGDSVIVEGQSFLADGQKVSVNNK